MSESVKEKADKKKVVAFLAGQAKKLADKDNKKPAAAAKLSEKAKKAIELLEADDFGCYSGKVRKLVGIVLGEELGGDAKAFKRWKTSSVKFCPVFHKDVSRGREVVVFLGATKALGSDGKAVQASREKEKIKWAGVRDISAFVAEMSHKDVVSRFGFIL